MFACLLENVADVGLILEPADALGADDALGPFAGHELVEESDVEGTAGIVNIGPDTVFLSFTFVMVVMMVVMSMLVFMFMFMLMLVFIIVVVIIIVFVMALHFLNPGGGGGYFIEVEQVGIDNLVEVYVAIVGVDNLGLGLQGSYNLTDAA